MTAAQQAAAMDARRGIVRLHPQAMAALGVRPWQPLILTGARATAALAAYAAPGSPVTIVVCDDLLLANLGVSPGAQVRVEPAAEQVSTRLRIAASREDIAQAIPPESLRLALLGKVVSKGDQVSLLAQDMSLPPGTDEVARGAARTAMARVLPDWQTLLLLVTDADPAVGGIVTMSTMVGWDGGTATATSASAPVQDDARPADLPGLEVPASTLHEWLDIAFHGRDLLARLGGTPQVGVLITGPAGSGKVAVVRRVAAQLGLPVQRLWGPTLAGTEPNAAAQLIRDTVASARAATPSILLIEDVDAIAPADGGPLLGLVLDTVHTVMSDPSVALICTSSAPASVSAAIRGAGLIDRQLEIPLPSREVRHQILLAVTRTMPLSADADLTAVAARTPGYVAADLVALSQEAALRAAQRQRGASPPPDSTVTMADFDEALQVVRPTSLLDDALEVPDLTLDDVGDLVEVKKVLTETVLWPLTYPDTFRRLGVEPARGVLLYGPPGCGKTFIVRALAGSGQANVIAVKGAELLSKWVGESERGVRDLFDRARQAAPSVIFLDEVDALAPVRGGGGDSGVTDRVVAALLTELDGVAALHNVVVVGATNRPDIIDPALLRPGRLERLIEVAPPDAAARTEILTAVTKKMPLAADVDLAAVAAGCDGYSAADCAALAREAALCAMRESMDTPHVTSAHFQSARAQVPASLSAVPRVSPPLPPG
jgi:transitional endoplasmic reticulum ATPase